MQGHGNYGKLDIKLNFGLVFGNRYTRGQSTSSALRYDFGLSKDESSGEEAEDTYTYLAIKLWIQKPLQFWEALWPQTV